jgi:hypothetical protein
MRPKPLALAAALSFALLAAPAPARAERVALLPATGTNVHEGHLAAATDVLRAYLERTGRFEAAIVPSPAAPGAEPTWAQLGETARAAGADLAVTLRIARLGNTALVRLGAYRPDGALAYADELSAATPDDLDPVLRRLAEGFAQGRPAREVAQIDTVTQKEAAPYRKQRATHVVGLRLGAIMLLNAASSSSDTATVAGGGVFWLYDARSWLAEVGMDLMRSEHAHLVAVGLGAYYPFSRGDVSPYLGGGVSYAWTDTGGDDAAGLQLRAVLGFLFGRLSNVQLRADVGWVANTFGERTPTGERRVANGPLLTVGIGF